MLWTSKRQHPIAYFVHPGKGVQVRLGGKYIARFQVAANYQVA
jgi:hypothetical protein